MSGIKTLLQQECLREDEYTILSVLSVCKLNAKKSRATSILVFAQQNETNFLSIFEIKIGENKEFKKKRSWLLDEFKYIDVKLNKHEFEFLTDIRYQFASILLNEKQSFLTMIYKSIQKSPLITNKAIFKNVPDSWKVDDSAVGIPNEIKKQPNDETSSTIEFDELKELSELEVMLENDSKKWLENDSSSVIRKIKIIILLLRLKYLIYFLKM